MVRFGVLAFAAFVLTQGMLFVFPATTDLTTWYAGTTLFVYTVVLVLAGYAFHTAVAGRPLFKSDLFEGLTL
jgi:hypothetical protein